MKGYRLSEQPALFGHADVIGFGTGDFYLEEIPREVANKIIIQNHYSGKVYAATYINLGLYMDNSLQGVLQYGYAMNPASQASVVANTAIDEYLELNRMWIDDECPRNSESKALSYSIKYIKKKYPQVKWIQSFADERCGLLGVVYQAANFGYYGSHVQRFFTLDGVAYHRSLMSRDPSLSKTAAAIQERRDEAVESKINQYRYLYFIKRNCKPDCKLKEKPYPKHKKASTTEEEMLANSP